MSFDATYLKCLDGGCSARRVNSRTHQKGRRERPRITAYASWHRFQMWEMSDSVSPIRTMSRAGFYGVNKPNNKSVKQKEH